LIIQAKELQMQRSLQSILLAITFALCSLASAHAEDRDIDPNAKILFLGDSITHAGEFIEVIEAQVRLQKGTCPELINLGLPSETCTGLSEPDHPFPRPNVHERIDRALAQIKPNVVVACYGMNDGIYYPFSEQRFQKYQQGIRDIIKKVKATDAKLVLMTPPAFDPMPLKKKGKLLPKDSEKFAWFSIYENYDEEVIKVYADWVLTLKDDVDMVIDLHTPVIDAHVDRRKENPDYTMSPDGVHVNSEGHAVLADAILTAIGIEDRVEVPSELASLISKKHQLTHSAWLSEVGHKRPGVKPGLPLAEMKSQQAKIDEQIRQQVQLIRDQK